MRFTAGAGGGVSEIAVSENGLVIRFFGAIEGSSTGAASGATNGLVIRFFGAIDGSSMGAASAGTNGRVIRFFGVIVSSSTGAGFAGMNSLVIRFLVTAVVPAAGAGSTSAEIGSITRFLAVVIGISVVARAFFVENGPGIRVEDADITSSAGAGVSKDTGGFAARFLPGALSTSAAGGNTAGRKGLIVCFCTGVAGALILAGAVITGCTLEVRFRTGMGISTGMVGSIETAGRRIRFLAGTAIDTSAETIGISLTTGVLAGRFLIGAIGEVSKTGGAAIAGFGLAAGFLTGTIGRDSAGFRRNFSTSA